jgi:hypothetical protein
MFIYIDENGNETLCANYATAREYQIKNNGNGHIARGMIFW